MASCCNCREQLDELWQMPLAVRRPPLVRQVIESHPDAKLIELTAETREQLPDRDLRGHVEGVVDGLLVASFELMAERAQRLFPDKKPVTREATRELCVERLHVHVQQHGRVTFTNLRVVFQKRSNTQS